MATVKVGGRGRLVLQLTMWAVIGVALVAIPALVSPNANNPSPTGDNTRSTTTGVMTAVPPTGSIIITQPSVSESWNLRDFILKLSLVLTVSVGLSALAMVRLQKRFRKTMP